MRKGAHFRESKRSREEWPDSMTGKMHSEMRWKIPLVIFLILLSLALGLALGALRFAVG